MTRREWAAHVRERLHIAPEKTVAEHLFPEVDWDEEKSLDEWNAWAEARQRMARARSIYRQRVGR